MDKIMVIVVKDTHFIIRAEFGHHLPGIQSVSFVEWTIINSANSLMELVPLFTENIL
jgi:hypothetical protein